MEIWLPVLKKSLPLGKTTSNQCPTTIAEICEGADTLKIDTEVPTVEQVKQAIKLLKNGKAPGIDQVHAEILIAECELLTPKLLTDIL